MRAIRSVPVLMLIFALCLASAASAGGPGNETGVNPEINQEYRPDLYPYVIHTDSADWYISQADIDLMGMEAILDGLEAVVSMQETDFADARAALDGYLEEVPPVRILTDFSGHAEISKTSSAYYNGLDRFIKVFHDWKHCDAALLHEYVHYLTLACARTPVRQGFWAEGIAEYVSRIVCKNRISRSVNMGASDEETAFFREKGAWDQEEDCLDEKILYFGIAELYHQGYLTGQSYFAVSNEIIGRTEKIQQNPEPDQLSMQEAASMTAYLVETYGKEAVYSCWNSDPKTMDQAFGRSFREIYAAWKVWNSEQCVRLGIEVDGSEPAAEP